MNLKTAMKFHVFDIFYECEDALLKNEDEKSSIIL
jgi:hypothetical protein